MRRKSQRHCADVENNQECEQRRAMAIGTNCNFSTWCGRNALKTIASTLLLLLLLLTFEIAESQDAGQHPQISQISPKSISHAADDAYGDAVASFMQTSPRLTLESTIAEGTAATHHKAKLLDLSPHEENETREHMRLQRSAQPILNEHYPRSGPNEVHFPDDTQKEAGAGRYFQYNIKPTGTIDDVLSETPESTKRARAAKTLSAAASTTAPTSASFLAKGGLRPLTSGSPISPTRSSATSTAASATATPPNPHSPRQNANPDIQDIITGIVKLLNGNVNVHANTQGLRRPTASRINNRGPPRISDEQSYLHEYDGKKPALGTSIRPPPYSGPFDRPDRPFITGVPIPEQIVPYRPGFVSNRPPWHRNKPRPPITTTMGGRRPIPQYKPMPQMPHMPPENEAPLLQQEQQAPPLPTLQEQQAQSRPPITADYIDVLDKAKPTDTTYDSEFSNEDANTQYIEVSDQDAAGAASGTDTEELDEEMQPPPPSPPSPPKKDEHGGKKKSGKPHKGGENKKPPRDDFTTIVQTSSVVNTVMEIASTYLPMPMESAEDVEVDPSIEEVIFMTPSRTPALETSAAIETTKTKETETRITTSPLAAAQTPDIGYSAMDSVESQATIAPTQSTIAPPPTTTTTTTISTTTNSAPTSGEPEVVTNSNPTPPPPPPPPQSEAQPQPQPQPPPAPTQPSAAPPDAGGPYHPRPGIVLDDPEFKPGTRPRPLRPQQARPPLSLPPQQPPPTNIQPTRQHLPPGYGEIFDVTLSAIQGPGSSGGGGSQQTINIKPYGAYGSGGGGGGAGGVQQQGDIIVAAADTPVGAHVPTTPASVLPQLPVGGSGSGAGGGTGEPVQPNRGNGYGVPDTEVVELQPTKAQSAKPPQQPQQQSPTTNSAPTRPHYRPRSTQPPVRIDTCIVGDDSTCDQAQHERCKTENGVSSCHCRPGYSRRKHREPCRKVISFYLGLRVDRIYEHRIVWDNKLMDRSSEPYGQLSYESVRAIDSAMSMTPYSDEFLEARVNNIYRVDPNLGGSGVFVNLTIKLDESVETLRPNLRSDVQKHLLGVLHRRNNNIGNSVLYVSSPEGAISALHDLDECQSRELNDCHESAACANSWGSFRCACAAGYRDPWADQPQRAGRDCQSCSDAYCNNRGTCAYNDEGNQMCTCDSSYYGGQCEIDGEVLGVAIGASVAAVIIIVLTLVCLIMWSRRWQREQKNAMGSPVFGYMNTAPMKTTALAQPGYQVTLEDRMRWAQIADVMAQTNHYGAEPIGPTRPSSAMFAYPNLQAMGMGTIGGMSLQSTMQMHQQHQHQHQHPHQSNNMAPPVPLPRYERLGLSARSNGMRTLENSSSSEEEDRTDLLGRNFQVPRPKSRSNGSIANQSGIYYDVDYEPSGNGIGNTSVDHLYGSQNQSTTHSHLGSSHMPGPQGIPMSTYTSGRAPSYYMK